MVERDTGVPTGTDESQTPNEQQGLVSGAVPNGTAVNGANAPDEGETSIEQRDLIDGAGANAPDERHELSAGCTMRASAALAALPMP